MAQYEEFTIDQGTDVSIELHLTNTDGSKKDLDGYTVDGKMKKNYNSGDSDTTTFTGIVASPASSGIINLSLTNEQTNSLRAGKYVYDVEISYDEDSATTIVERVIEGKIFVTPSVTK
jgi:hypothetical protein